MGLESHFVKYHSAGPVEAGALPQKGAADSISHFRVPAFSPSWASWKRTKGNARHLLRWIPAFDGPELGPQCKEPEGTHTQTIRRPYAGHTLAIRLYRLRTPDLPAVPAQCSCCHLLQRPTNDTK
jgi:hypothetical protein